MYLLKKSKKTKVLIHYIVLTLTLLALISTLSCSEKGKKDEQSDKQSFKTKKREGKQKKDYANAVDQMIKVQNVINSYRAMYGRYPTDDEAGNNYDPWGNPIVYTLYMDLRKVYDFILYSKGPDHQKDTEDDLRIINYRDDSKSKSAAGKGETAVSSTEELLESLGDFKDEEDDYQEKQQVEYNMSLDSLKENADDILGGSGGKSVSLEDFKKLNKQ